MRLYTIPKLTFAKIHATARPGEIVLVPEKAFAYQAPHEYRKEYHVNGVFFVEGTWRIRDGNGRSITDYTVTAQGYTRKMLLFAERQHARRKGRELCEIHGIRWTP